VKSIINVNREVTVTKIAICGQLRSGKDAAGDRFRLHHRFRAFAFADYVKKTAHTLFPHIPADPKPRRLYQQIGEKACEIDPLVWVRLTERQIGFHIDGSISLGDEDIRVIITDLRKPAEYEWARANGYSIVRITASEDVRLARAKAAGDAFELEDLAHDTESHVAGFGVDFDIVNDGSLAELHEKVDEVVAKIREAE
jgi:hypothetical protein